MQIISRTLRIIGQRLPLAPSGLPVMWFSASWELGVVSAREKESQEEVCWQAGVFKHHIITLHLCHILLVRSQSQAPPTLRGRELEKDVNTSRLLVSLNNPIWTYHYQSH